MTDAVQAFSLGIPAGNGSTLEYFIDCHLGWSEVTQIIIQFPAGPSGNVGVRVEYATNPVYPVGNNQWFVADNYVLTIPVTNQQQGGQWRFTGYNTDQFPHTIDIWFYYNYVTASTSSISSGLVAL
jgi:hypothetical protein